MSTRKFNAKGLRHGFPQRGFNLPVDDLPWWTTLSGVNRDNYAGFSPSALAAKIAESQQMAADLFYRLKTVYGTASASDDASTGNSVSLAPSYLVGHTVNGLDVIPSEPYQRIGAGSLNPFIYGMDLETDSYVALSSPIARVGWGRFGMIGASTRMTLGGDLVGYCFSSNASLQSTAWWSGISLQAYTAFSRCGVLHVSSTTSYFEDTAASDPNYAADVGYITEQGYHFVGVVWADGLATRSVDLASMSASASSSPGGTNSSAEASFTSFDFYDTFA